MMLPVTQTVQCRMMGRLLINEIERMKKDTVMVKFEVLYRHWVGGAVENKENPQSMGRYLKHRLPRKKQYCYPLNRNFR
jgi:hypothetical protein